MKNKRRKQKQYFIKNKKYKIVDLTPEVKTTYQEQDFVNNIVETKSLFEESLNNTQNEISGENDQVIIKEVVADKEELDNDVINHNENISLDLSELNQNEAKDEIDDNLFELVEPNKLETINEATQTVAIVKEEKNKKEKIKKEKTATQKKLKRVWNSFLDKIPFIPKKNNFDFEDFEKNVEYQEFADGSKLKVVAEIKDIHLSFKNPANPKVKNKVLRGPSIKFYEGKVHAIIGESGSGKSVLTSLLYGLTGNNAVIDSGEIKIFNNNVEKFSFKDWENSNFLGKVISAVFQNPMSTLNPTMKVGTQITEGMLINKIAKTKKEAYQLAIEYLRLTKINSPEEVMKLYPHEMSGGMIQRVVIAAIVALKPKIIVMDEPTTALDPTVQALVLDVIRELQEKFKITIIFITHDLGVVASISDYISIMYAGQIIEEGTREEIIHNPQHPYTWGLILSMPDVNKGKRLYSIRGSIPSSLNNIVGEAFAPRNDYALGIDFIEEAPFVNISQTHRVKSWLLDPRAPKINKPELIKQKHDLWKENKKHEA